MNLSQQILESLRDQLIKEFQISTFEKADPSHSVCSIGFSDARDKWYGWSHRAVAGFGIGDKMFDPDWKPDDMSQEEVEKMPFTKRGSKEIANFDQAKEAAKKFARYVS